MSLLCSDTIPDVELLSVCAGDLAKLITISVAMFEDVLHFVTILALFVASFSVAFYVLLRGVGDGGHVQVIDAVYSTLAAMLGDFDSSMYISNAAGSIHAARISED